MLKGKRLIYIKDKSVLESGSAILYALPRASYEYNRFLPLQKRAQLKPYTSSFLIYRGLPYFD